MRDVPELSFERISGDVVKKVEASKKSPVIHGRRERPKPLDARLGVGSSRLNE